MGHIKKTIEYLSQEIKSMHERIAEVRKKCPHEKSSIGIWEWASGHQLPGMICEECGTVTDGIDPKFSNIIITTSQSK